MLDGVDRFFVDTLIGISFLVSRESLLVLQLGENDFFFFFFFSGFVDIFLRTWLAEH